jgi:hypothetical protein
MVKESILTLARTTRSVIKAWSALAIFTGLYVLLLATLYGFIATREATITQVLLTLLFVAAAPLLFFLLQAAIISGARTGRIDWSQALRDSSKLALVTLPVLLLGIGIMWLLNRWQGHYPTPPQIPAYAPVPSNGTPTHWPTVLFTTARVLIFGITLPLVMIQLWLAVAGPGVLALLRGGGRTFLQRLGQILARATSSQSVFIFALGLIVFALLPYVLLFVHLPVKGAWSEVGVFTLRLVVVFALILFGWIITLSTLAKLGHDPTAAEVVPSTDRSDLGHEDELEPSAA